MADITCSICLEELKSPVSTPCGHLHCEECLTKAIEANADLMDSSCPTCRAPFCIMQPDLRFVPQKFHKFIVPSIRRVYLNASSQDRNTMRMLKSKVGMLEERVSALTRDKYLLMDRCEAAMAASSSHATAERAARLENERLKRELEGMKASMEELKGKYDGVKGKYREIKHHRKESISSPATVMLSSAQCNKRNRSQASLDTSPQPSSSTLPGSRLAVASDISDTEKRLILPVPKRPRIHYRFQVPEPDSPEAPPAPPPPVFRKRRGPGAVEVPTDAPTYPLSRSFPARSGIPSGDVFSPSKADSSDCGGQGSIDYGTTNLIVFSDDAREDYDDGEMDRRERKHRVRRPQSLVFRGARVLGVFSEDRVEEVRRD